MKIIKVKHRRMGYHQVFVDDEDYERLSKFKWHITTNAGKLYVVRTKTTGKYCSKEIAMHRDILNITDPKILIDHKDQNGLNNTRNNIRIATKAQNAMNMPPYNQPYTSKFKGVSWRKDRNKWRAYIVLNNKQHPLGHYDNEAEAAIVYNQKAIELFGEFACLNKIA